jgi:predicted metal-dependent peptidase
MSTNTQQDVAKAGRTLMLKEPFYGYFLVGLNKEFNKAIPTACVAKDGINIKLVVNPEYYDKQDINTKVAILKHELLHIAFEHLGMFDDFKDKQLLNVAADLEINQYIEEHWKGETWEGLEIVNGEFKGVKLPPKAGTRKYYELLQTELDEYDKQQQQQGQGQGQGQGTGGSGSGNGKSNNGENGSGDNDEEGDGEDGMGGSGSGGDKFAEWFRGQGHADEHSLWEEFENMSEAEKKLIKKQIDHQMKEVAEQVQKQRGTIPGELSSYINKLFEKTEAVIDWKSYLRRFGARASKIETKKTRKKPNIRFGSGPAIKINPKRKTLVAIDTSGSVSDQDLVEFFHEIEHIFKSGTEVTIMECDSYVHRTYEYKGLKEDVLRVSGRGGTSFQPVMDEVLKAPGKYMNIIYLTDGYAPAPDKVPLVPILWVHNSNTQINEELPGTKIQIKHNK